MHAGWGGWYGTVTTMWEQLAGKRKTGIHPGTETHLALHGMAPLTASLSTPAGKQQSWFPTMSPRPQLAMHAPGWWAHLGECCAGHSALSLAVYGASDHLSPNLTLCCLTVENGAIVDHDPQMLLVCEHVAEPEIAFTVWAVPIMAAAESALPSQLSLPQLQVPALPTLAMQGVYSIKTGHRSQPWLMPSSHLMPDLVFHLD